RIAMRYNVTVDELARLNGIINSGSIQVGQRLLVPSGPASGMVPLPQTHTVQPGESLESIAQLYNLTAADLTVLNVIPDTGQVYVGQILTISLGAIPPAPVSVDASPVEAAAAMSSTDNTPMIHSVQRGET